MRSLPKSAWAAWARSIKHATRGSIGRSRSRSCQVKERPLRTLSQRVSRAEADHRYELPVEFPEPIWSKPFDRPQHSCGVCQEPLDINALTSRRERCQVARASRQHVDRPVVIPTAKMVERDANLQDALIEAAYLALLSPPQQLQCFVLLEVLAAVELRDPLPQKRRWRFIALT